MATLKRYSQTFSVNTFQGTEVVPIPHVEFPAIFVLFSNFDADLTDRSIGSVTLAGLSLTQLRADEISGAGGQRTEIWYKTGISSGTQNLVWANSSGANAPFIDGTIFILSGVNQSNPINCQDTNTGTGITSLSKTFTTTQNGVVIFDVINTSSSSATVNSGQAEQSSLSGGTSKTSFKDYSVTGSNSMGWTFSSQNAVMSIVGIAPQETENLTNAYRHIQVGDGMSRSEGAT